MNILLQIIIIGLACVIAFLALYTLLILVFNFVQMKKESVSYSNNNKKDTIIFSGTANNSTTRF